MDVLDRCESQLILQNRSRRTRESYLRCARLFIAWLDDIDNATEADVRRYLVHVVTELGYSPSNLKLHLAAIKYLFIDVLDRREIVDQIPWPRVPIADIELLTQAEVRRLFAAAPTLLHKTILMAAYSSGLRVGEVVALQHRDIDSDRMLLHVRRGKGARLRTVMLADSLLIALRQYWRCYRPARPWLFPSPRNPERHISPREVQRRFRQAAEAARIRKTCSMHSLRHAFSTHLLESGVDIATLQKLLGHRRIATTMRYVHLRTDFITSTTSPLDLTPK